MDLFKSSIHWGLGPRSALQFSIAFHEHSTWTSSGCLLFWYFCVRVPKARASLSRLNPNSVYVIVYTKRNKFWHPYLINTIEMRSLRMEIRYIKSTVRLLDRVWVNKGGLDLSKKVLWVFVGQRAADLRAVKVGGQQKILPSGPVRTRFARARADWQNILLTSNFDNP